MKLVILVAVLHVVLATPQDTEWFQWKNEHGKQYKNAREENYRYGIWKKNINLINKHNKLADAGKETYWLGMNHLGDLTPEEVVKMLNGLIGKDYNYNSTDAFKSSPNFIPEDEVDWRTKGAVTPVKNQGQCGSCWAFSATGSLEGQHFLKNGQLISLSEQNLIDCSKHYGNEGCSGGLMDHAFEYVIKNKGIDTEESYPYKAEDRKCHFKNDSIGATEKSYRNVFKYDVAAVVEACTKIGPISAGMDARWGTFHMYKKGIYSDSHCSSFHLDHGVLIVGYGTENGDDYFLVKNSWGTKWGMDGYFMISRKHNMCGMASQASYPIV